MHNITDTTGYNFLKKYRSYFVFFAINLFLNLDVAFIKMDYKK